MQVLKHIIPYQKQSESFYIAFIGDTHIGHRTVDWPTLKRVLNWIRENKAFWIGMGDWAHAIAPHPNERRFDLDELDPQFLTPEQQYKKVYELLEPIRRQGLMILTGNHDDVLRRRHYHDFVDALAYKLGVAYAGYDGFLRLVFKRGRHRQRLDIYAHHGFYGGRTKTGKINRLTDMANLFEADVYAMGHVHEIDHTTNVRLYVDSRLHVQEKVQHFLVTGGFIRGYVPNCHTYIERRMLRPTRLGSIALRFWPETRKIEVIEI